MKSLYLSHGAVVQVEDLHGGEVDHGLDVRPVPVPVLVQAGAHQTNHHAFVAYFQ